MKAQQVYAMLENVELIAVRHLNSSFARFLRKSLRPTYRTLVRRSRGQA